MPIMQRSHMPYSADLQRFTILDRIAPSGRWYRSLTKYSFTHPDSAQGIDENHLFYETDIWSTVSRQQLSTVLSQGPSRLAYPQHRAPYFCDPEHISGLSSVRARSASSSACSFRRQPEWLLTLTSVTVPNHRRSSTKWWYITSE